MCLIWSTMLLAVHCTKYPASMVRTNMYNTKKAMHMYVQSKWNDIWPLPVTILYMYSKFLYLCKVNPARPKLCVVNLKSSVLYWYMLYSDYQLVCGIGSRHQGWRQRCWNPISYIIIGVTRCVPPHLPVFQSLPPSPHEVASAPTTQTLPPGTWVCRDSYESCCGSQCLELIPITGPIVYT